MQSATMQNSFQVIGGCLWGLKPNLDSLVIQLLTRLAKNMQVLCCQCVSKVVDEQAGTPLLLLPLVSSLDDDLLGGH